MIRSTDAEVRALVRALAEDEARREAAVARLIIIGARAVGRLVSAYAEAQPGTRLALLRVLEVTGDERALPLALDGIARGGDLAVGAVAVLRELAARGSPAVQARALERLLDLTGSPEADLRLKLAAREALEAVMPDAAVLLPPPPARSESDALWADALNGRLPDDPAALLGALGDRTTTAPLTTVLKLIETVRAREARGSGTGWLRVRGTLHQALAARGSRIALDDLRDTLLRARTPLPPPFLVALQLVGDDSCLEPLARAHASAAEPDAAWRRHLAETFKTILRARRLTRRHAAVRRALALAPAIGGSHPAPTADAAPPLFSNAG